MADIRLKKRNGKIYIFTPYNTDFINKIKTVGGRWDRDAGAWTTHEKALEAVRQVLLDVYGENDIYTPAKVDVRLTFHENTDYVCEAFEEFCRKIVIASGRDSGARMGDGCVLEAGHVDSGGSRAKWRTVIEAGTSIIVYDVPEILATKVIDDIKNGDYHEPCMTCEIIASSKIDKEALKAEKEKLLARIREIDEILNA